MVTLLLNLEQRSRSKRNKWRGPPSEAREGSSPFMPDCFLSVAEGSADRLRLPHSSNDTNRLAILDSDGPKKSIKLSKSGRRFARKHPLCSTDSGRSFRAQPYSGAEFPGLRRELQIAS